MLTFTRGSVDAVYLRVFGKPSSFGGDAVIADPTQISLAYMPPTSSQTRRALAGAVALLIGLAAFLPFAAMPLPRVDGFIPALDAIIFVSDLITAGLLFSHFSVTRSKALWALGCGYLFSAVMVVGHLVTFPGAISDTVSFGGDLHINFRVYLLWHLGIPVGVSAYLWFRKRGDLFQPRAQSGIIRDSAIAAAISLIICTAWLTLLPPVNPVEGRWLTVITMAVCGFALVALWMFRRSTLDQWLLVVVLAMIVELAITALIGGRGPKVVTLGFYVGRLFSLVTSTLVLFALLAETTKLYTAVARADLLSLVARDSRILSSDIEMPQTIERLLRVFMENSRASLGLLIGPSGDEYVVLGQAHSKGSKVTVTRPRARMSDDTCPCAILEYVIRSKETVVLGASTESAFKTEFSGDRYLSQHHPASVLCLPLVHQEHLVGLIYLEEALTPHTFTPERTQLLEVLASQAAISLQNAALYTNLQRSEAFLAQGERVSETGSFGWDAASGDLYWSQQLYSMLEYDQTLLPASMEHALARVHVDDLEHVRRLLEGSLRNRTEFETTLRLTMPDGRTKHAQITGRSIPTGNLAFVGSVRDISEHVQAEATLRKIQADLAHVSRVAALNAMSASIGHEVSQPLSGVVINARMAARMLAANPPDVEGALQTVERTLRDANRAAQVITRLRAMFAKKEPTLELLNLNEATKDVVALSSVEVQRHKARLRIELAEDLPFVHGDRVQLQQVILNLVLNAVDAMVSVADQPRILTISTGREYDGTVRLSVRDSGVGIPADVVDQLFQPFYTTKPNGLGVGLSICQSIIDAHHGRLWVEQNKGPGATFSFCLPPA